MAKSPFPPLSPYIKGPSQKCLDPIAASPSSFVEVSWIEGWEGSSWAPLAWSRRRNDNPSSCLRPRGFPSPELERSLNLRED